jgi:hypothetical protein
MSAPNDRDGKSMPLSVTMHERGPLPDASLPVRNLQALRRSPVHRPQRVPKNVIGRACVWIAFLKQQFQVPINEHACCRALLA